MENPELPFKLVYPLARAHVHVAKNRLEQVVDKAIKRRDSETGKDHHHRYQREKDRLTIERLEREKLEATQRLGECRRNRRATSEQLGQSQRELADVEQRLGDSKRHREADMQNLVRFRRQVEKDESIISGLKSAASQSAEQADMARAEFEQCRASKAMAQQSLRQKERDLQACMAESDRLKRLGKNLRASIKADKNALLESKAEVARLQSETNTLRDKYKLCEETVADNKKAAEALQTELAAKQEEIETLVHEAGDHGTNLSQLRQEMSRLEARCDETVAALQQSQAQGASLKTRLREAQARQATLENLDWRHEKTIKNVRAREEKLAQQLVECSRRERNIIEQLRQSQIELDGARQTAAEKNENLVNLTRQANTDRDVALAELEQCRTSKAAAEESLQATIAEIEESKRLGDNLQASIEKDKADLQETKLEVARLRRDCTKFREEYETCKAEKKATEDKAVEDLEALFMHKQKKIDLDAEQHGTISSRLKQEMGELRAGYAKTIADLDQSRQNATESDSALALCRAQLVKVETSLAAAQAKEKSLDKLKRNHEETIKKVKGREEKLAQELGECRRREQTAVEQLGQREREVAELKRNREADRQNLVELRRQAIDDKASLQGEARRSAERAAAALAELEECRASKEAANTSLAEKEGKLKACIAERDSANGRADELVESIRALEAVQRNLESEVKRLEAEKNSLCSQLESDHAATTRLEERDADNQTAIQRLKKEIEDLEGRAGDHGATIAQLMQQLTELREAHAETGVELARLRESATECNTLLEHSTGEVERLKRELEDARADEAELRARTVQQQEIFNEVCERRAMKAEDEFETARQAQEAAKTRLSEKEQLLQTTLEELERCKEERESLYGDILSMVQLANAVLTETRDESFEAILDRIGVSQGAFKDDMIALREKIKDIRARLASENSSHSSLSKLRNDLQDCQDQARAERERLEGERDAAMKQLADESNDVQVMIEMAGAVVDDFESADGTVIDTLGQRLLINRPSFVNHMKSLKEKIGELLFDMHQRAHNSAADVAECEEKLKKAGAEVNKLKQEAIDARATINSDYLAVVETHRKELADLNQEKDEAIESLRTVISGAETVALAHKEEFQKQSAKLTKLERELNDAKQHGLETEKNITAERDACLASKQLVEAKIRFMGDQVDLLQAARRLFTQTLDIQQQTARDSLLPRIRELKSRVELARTNDDTLDGVLGSLDQLKTDLESAPTERGAIRRDEEDINQMIEILVDKAQADTVVSANLQDQVAIYRSQLDESFRQSQQLFAQRVALKKEFEEILEGFERGLGKRVKRSAFDLGKLFVWM